MDALKLHCNISKVKQGDSSSVVELFLRDKYSEPFTDLNGREATVTFKLSDGIAFRKTITVEGDKLTFTIDTILAVAQYDIEVTCDNYIFPSAPYSATIRITESHINYQDVAPLERVATIEEVEKLIAKIGKVSYDDTEIKALISAIQAEITLLKEQEGNYTQYDDTGLREALKGLSDRIDAIRPYDDTELRGRVENLEAKPDLVSRLEEVERRVDNDTIYDDTEVKNRIAALEAKPDNDTVYNDTELREAIADLSTKVEQALQQGGGTTYDDTEVKRRLTDLENANADLSTRNYVLEKVSTNITMGGGAPNQQTDTARRMMRLNKLGLGITHLDFKTLASNVTGPIFTLPNDAPAPKQLIEIQFHNGATAWINAGTRTVSTENLPANTRYIVDWIGFYL